MKCALCDGDIVKKTGGVLFKSKTLGEITVPDIEFKECESCGDKLLSPAASDKMIDYVRQKEQEVIGSLPIDDFIPASEAADILGFTKQAFSKHPKIKRGLIYSVIKGKRKLFLKKSVELFKEKGNGKFLMPRKDLYDPPRKTKTKLIYSEVKNIKVVQMPGMVSRSAYNLLDKFDFDVNVSLINKDIIHLEQ